MYHPAIQLVPGISAIPRPPTTQPKPGDEADNFVPSPVHKPTGLIDLGENSELPKPTGLFTLGENSDLPKPTGLFTLGEKSTPPKPTGASVPGEKSTPAKPPKPHAVGSGRGASPRSPGCPKSPSSRSLFPPVGRLLVVPGTENAHGETTKAPDENSWADWHPVELSTFGQRDQRKVNKFSREALATLYSHPFQSSQWTRDLQKIRKVVVAIQCEATAHLWLVYHLFGDKADHYRSLDLLSFMEREYPSNKEIKSVRTVYAVYTAYMNPVLVRVHIASLTGAGNPDPHRCYEPRGIESSSSDEEEEQGSVACTRRSRLASQTGPHKMSSRDKSSSPRRSRDRSRSSEDESEDESGEESIDEGVNTISLRNRRRRQYEYRSAERQSRSERPSKKRAMRNLLVEAKTSPMAAALYAYCDRIENPKCLPSAHTFALGDWAASYGVYVNNLPLPEPDKINRVLVRREMALEKIQYELKCLAYAAVGS